MPKTQQEFHLLMRRVQEGSEEAARELLERYGSHIRRVVRRKLSKQLRAKFDSLDFVQDVWTSFFADTRSRVFDRPEALIAYLARMAHHKVLDKLRQSHNLKYDVGRERSLESTPAGSDKPLAARQPTPSQVVSAQELWERLLEGQPEHYRRILNSLRQGKTQLEIAREVGLNRRSIARIIRKLAEGGAS